MGDRMRMGNMVCRGCGGEILPGPFLSVSGVAGQFHDTCGAAARVIAEREGCIAAVKEHAARYPVGSEAHIAIVSLYDSLEKAL